MPGRLGMPARPRGLDPVLCSERTLTSEEPMAAIRTPFLARLLVTSRTRRLLAILAVLALGSLGTRPCAAQQPTPPPAAPTEAASVIQSVRTLTQPGDLLLVRGAFGE